MIGVRTVAVWTAERGSPKAELLPAGQRRRCSLLTRMIAEVVADLRTGGLAIAEAPIVCGTGYGEIATTAALLEQMHTEEGGLSPIRFAGSVHNTAIGQLSIAIEHRGVSTATSAGPQTLAMSLFEAIGLLAGGAPDVALVLADEPLPAPLQPPYDGLAVALHLVRDPAPGDVVLDGPRPDADAPVSARVPASIALNPCAPAWTLAQAITARAAGVIALETRTDRRPPLCVRLSAR